MFSFVKLYALLMMPKDAYFLVKTKSFIHLNEPYVLKGSYVNVISLMAITTNQAFY